MSNFAPYNQYGVARYKPGCLIDATAEFIAATNTANIPQAPISIDTATGLTYVAGQSLVFIYKDAYGYETSYSYTIPAGVFNPTRLGEFIIQNFAGQLTFYSDPALFGVGTVKAYPTNTGIEYGLQAPVFTILNVTTNASVVFPLTFAAEKRIVPGRIVIRDYITDDLFHTAFPGQDSNAQNRGFLHTVRPCDQVAAAAGVVNFAGVSGNPSMHMSYNRLGVRSTGMYDTVLCYRRALILVEPVLGQFNANTSNIGAIFAETTPGNEGKIRATANATTVALPPSAFSFVSARGYGGAVVVSVNTI
jgi:hypothetical protein